MLPPLLAKRLRARGYDIVAVAADPDLAGMADEQALAVATADERCLVTENARDFELRRTKWIKEGQGGLRHAWLPYTMPRRFPRGRHYLGRLIAALDGRLAAARPPGPGQVDWLPRRNRRRRKKLIVDAQMRR